MRLIDADLLEKRVKAHKKWETPISIVIASTPTVDAYTVHDLNEWRKAGYIHGRRDTLNDIENWLENEIEGMPDKGLFIDAKAFLNAIEDIKADVTNKNVGELKEGE